MGTDPDTGFGVTRRAALAGFASLVVPGVGGSAIAGSELQRPAPEAWRPATLPLRVRDRAYLVDHDGLPFLLHGDTAWSLIADLRKEDAEFYLEDRRRRGFNAILVNLIERRFASQAPRNAYGHAPFEAGGSFTRLNEDYFRHAEWVVGRAAEKGLVVLLAPAYLGYTGGDQGWYREMRAAGSENLRRYAEQVGRRFRSFRNVIWVHGGDFDPPEREMVSAVAEGVRSGDPDGLHTVHCAPETAAADLWGGMSWLDLNTLYTYEPVHRAALHNYEPGRRPPALLIESAYENEHGAAAHRVRTQAYDALLCGAIGHVYGNNPIWHFSGPGLFASPATWQQALDSDGARSMTHLRRLFESLAWWTLVPDVGGKLVRSAPSHNQDRIVAAVTSDKSTAVVYVPTDRAAPLALGELGGADVRVRWYDPAAGTFETAGAGRFSGYGVETFNRGARNSGGQSDWVLVLERD